MTGGLGVVVVNYNGGDYIGDCLESLRRTSPSSRVVVVDNASSDGSPDEIAARFPHVTVIRHTENLGFTGGSNAGIRRCLEEGCDWVMLLNPDTVVLPGAIATLREAAERRPRSIVGPRLLMYDDPSVPNDYGTRISFARGRIVGAGGGGRPIAASETPVEVLSGCCLLAAASAWRETGLLDDRYFLYYEDLDLALRARAAGYSLWIVEASQVLHRESRATGGRQSPLANYYFVRNRHHFVREHAGRTRAYPVFLAYEVGDVAARTLAAAVSGRRPLARALVRGLADGWRGRTGRAAL